MGYDFSLDNYDKLLDAFSGYDVNTVLEYLEKRPKKEFIILRHDVDLDIKYALKMAKKEYSKDIRSTYYIRFKKNILDYDIITQISSMGHEIGYHYETLTKMNGNVTEALSLFKKELAIMNSKFQVKSISMHGSPLSIYDNSDVWKYADYKILGIIGDAQLSITGINYYTDTGGKWNSQHNIRDYIKSNTSGIVKEFNNSDVIKMLDKGVIKEVYFNIHPERWSSNKFDEIKIQTRDFIYNLGKRIIRSVKR